MQEGTTDTGRSERIELRASPYEKNLLARAAVLEHLDLTSFVVRTAVPVAREIVERTERVVLSERDTLKVLDLLENPPPPNARLAAAIGAWAENRHRLTGE